MGPFKGVLAILGIIICFSFFPMMMDSAHEIRTDVQVDSLASVTGSGETTDDVTLNRALYDANIANITTITSTLGTDNPAASTYVLATRALTVGGLTASGTRTLTVTYEYSATDEYTGLGEMVDFSPMFIFMGIIITALMAGYAGYKHFKD
jgi:hypothetical protein